MFEIIGLVVGEFGQLKTARCASYCQMISDSRTEMVEDFFWQDDPSGFADPADLEIRFHTEAITVCARYGDKHRI